MRVLQVGKFYHPATGGIETAVQLISEGLVQRGHSVTVLCFSHNGQSSEETIHGVRVVRVGSLGKVFSQPIAPRLPSAVRELARDADLLHFHSPNPAAEWIGGGWVGSQKKVTTYHCDVVSQAVLIPFYRPVLDRYLRKMQKIACTSASQIGFSRFLGPFREKCEVIPYGIGEERVAWNPRVQSLTRKLVQKHGSFFLFVGRLVPYKGLSVLLDAMKEIEGKVLIVGDGPLRAELEARSRRLGLGQKVVFEGEVVDPEVISSYFHACEFLVLPSVSVAEAFGIVMAEAMACEKPLISTDLRSGVIDVNIDQVTGIRVPPSQPVALAEAIRKMIGDPELRVKMGKAGREHYEKNFTTTKMVESYLRLYESI